MSYRYMRMVVFFDLPTTTYSERKAYRKFREFLINEGFVMMQESVYCKLALNQSIVTGETKRLHKNKPKQGIVQILTITEKQFSSMEYLVGKSATNIIDTESRLIIV